MSTGDALLHESPCAGRVSALYGFYQANITVLAADDPQAWQDQDGERRRQPCVRSVCGGSPLAAYSQAGRCGRGNRCCSQVDRPRADAERSCSTPNFCDSVSSRFAIGVLWGVSMWRLPRTRPAPPPTIAVRQRPAGVPVAVAHAAAVDDQRMIQQRTVAVGRRAQPLDEAANSSMW